MCFACVRACGHCGVRQRPRVQCAQQQSVQESQISSVALLNRMSNITSQLRGPFEAAVGGSEIEGPK
jgi:hypothetical protein